MVVAAQVSVPIRRLVGYEIPSNYQGQPIQVKVVVTVDVLAVVELAHQSLDLVHLIGGGNNGSNPSGGTGGTVAHLVFLVYHFPAAGLAEQVVVAVYGIVLLVLEMMVDLIMFTTGGGGGGGAQP